MTTPDDLTVRPFGELRSSGLLWLVNRTTFHPRGWTLGLAPGPDGEPVGWSLLGDGREVWAMGDGIDEQALFDAVAETLRSRR